MDPETHCDAEGHATSRKSRDLASIHHLRTWLDNPVLETAIKRQQNETARLFFQVSNERMKAAAARRAEAAKEGDEDTDESDEDAEERDQAAEESDAT